LADPVPIADLIVDHAALGKRLAFAATVTTVDALLGIAQLDAQPESVRQVAMADQLVITKSDVAPPGQAAALAKRVAEVNPLARIVDASASGFDAWTLVADGAGTDPAARLASVKQWLNARQPMGADAAHGDHIRHDHEHSGRHGPRIRTFSVSADVPIEWAAFAMWMNTIARRYGSKILRMKGLLHIKGASGPVAVHGIQHVVHPPEPLEAWSDDDRSSRIVFIVEDIDPRPIQASLASLLRRRAAIAGKEP
jgi:G3E family GTPase